MQSEKLQGALKNLRFLRNENLSCGDGKYTHTQSEAQSFTENRKKLLLDHPAVSCNDASVWMSTIVVRELLTNQEWVHICIQYINILQYAHFIYKHTYMRTYYTCTERDL